MNIKVEIIWAWYTFLGHVGYYQEVVQEAISEFFDGLPDRIWDFQNRKNEKQNRKRI